MITSTIGKSSLKISYWVFFILLAALFLLLAVASRSEFAPNPAPFLLLFAIAFVWQVFTLYHNRHHFLTWILAVLYAIPALMFVIYVLQVVA